MGKRGRPSKFTQSNVDQILGYIGDGVPRQIACAAVGVSRSTFQLWVTKARAKDPEYLGFFRQLKMAESRSYAFHVRNINEHAKKSWLPSAWMLERRLPQFFAKDTDILKEIEKEIKRRSNAEAQPV